MGLTLGVRITPAPHSTASNYVAPVSGAFLLGLTFFVLTYSVEASSAIELLSSSREPNGDFLQPPELTPLRGFFILAS